MLATCFMLISSFPYSSTLKIEKICSTETSIDFQQTTPRYIKTELFLIFLYERYTEHCPFSWPYMRDTAVSEDGCFRHQVSSPYN
jgi:hypothetical protein